MNGFVFSRDEPTLPNCHVDYIDFDEPKNNIFRAVNQLTVRERNVKRRPDVLLFVNGIPLCIIEPLSVKITFATLSVLHGVVKHAIFAGVYR